MTPASIGPRLSLDVVIPVHNEAAVVYDRLGRLRVDFASHFGEVRFIPVENGSVDATWAILEGMRSEWCQPERSPVADYGAALRCGVAACEAPMVMLAEIDFCEVLFAAAARDAMREGASLVQSSKAAAGSEDVRPLVRRIITWGFNATLRLVFGFGGTDTHGMKFGERDTVRSLLAECVLDGDLLATEMILRAHRAGLNVVEIPVRVSEQRRPSIGILKRVPSTLRDLVRLRRALRS